MLNFNVNLGPFFISSWPNHNSINNNMKQQECETKVTCSYMIPKDLYAVGVCPPDGHVMNTLAPAVPAANSCGILYSDDENHWN